MTNQKTNKILLTAGLTLFALLVVFFSFYAYWDSAPADKTCARCHEIKFEVHQLESSSHRDLACKECHGTALSQGVRSMKEKSKMVVDHIRKVNTEDIRMNEEQVIEVMSNCQRCHSFEYAKWKAGKHSATYNDIFLDSLHNSTEQLNFDCLRCHGMYYKGSISDLVEPLSTEGPWKLKDTEQGNNPTIPCLTCHNIHIEGDPICNISKEMRDSLGAEYNPSRSGLGIYDRAEKAHFNVKSLPMLKLYKGNDLVTVSEDPGMRNCVQCHAPNSWHQAGTGDDKTPLGVHSGLSCLACHDPHSNDAKNSCINCHPAISNCKMDVTKMDVDDIHTVSCADCHDDKRMSSR